MTDISEDKEGKRVVRRDAYRKDKLSVVFNGERIAEGWFFRVSEAFRPALDIHLTTRIDKETKCQKLIWTEGFPPAYAFRDGDNIPSQAKTPEGIERFILSVMKAEPDLLLQSPKRIVQGSVEARLLEWNGEQYIQARSIMQCSQSQFAKLLRTGKLDSHGINFHSENAPGGLVGWADEGSPTSEISAGSTTLCWASLRSTQPTPPGLPAQP